MYMGKMRSFKLLHHIFQSIPSDVIYTISKFTGKYIHFPKIENKAFKTKSRSDKYYTKHLVTKTRFRTWSL